MPTKPILIVDQDQDLNEAIREALTQNGYTVEAVENGLQALEKFKTQSFELMIVDLRTPGLSGMDVLRKIKSSAPATPVIMTASCGNVETAVEAMREGAFDFIPKPFPLDLMLESIDRAFEIFVPLARRLPTATSQPGDRPIITHDPGMQRMLRIARNVAPSRATVLLQGDSGTGKELLARYIHRHSDRSSGTFVAVNCASLPEGLLESELFGHEKGSFTGAISRKIGKFELADQGTILLDEISEMDLALQAKLLRVLQEGEIDRVGGQKPVKIDVRVIATTNRDLKAWVDKGEFRQDLYYRLNVIPLTIPPLRNRPDDISLLADHFLTKYAAAYQKNRKPLSAKALARLTGYDWPGNVRELENMISRGVLLAAGPAVDVMDIFLDEIDSFPAPAYDVAPLSPDQVMTIRDMERGLIEQALVKTDGNRTHAAKILGISVRTLRNKLSEYKELGFDFAGQAA